MDSASLQVEFGIKSRRLWANSRYEYLMLAGWASSLAMFNLYWAYKPNMVRIYSPIMRVDTIRDSRGI